jgi:aconitate hydratase
MGFSPNSAGVSLRTFNRNFEGRSGTKDAGVYLVSPEVAVASALTGYITDPETLGECPEIEIPSKFKIDDSAILLPASEEEAKSLSVRRGPNIKPFPETRPLADRLEASLTLKVGDNITTDHIMPAGAKILPYRSNIPYLSKFCFAVCDESFAERAREAGSSVIVGGVNYGQGSSREHAALVPLYLGVRAVVAKSFARIHAANLVNAGILPLTFRTPEDYERLNQGNRLVLENLHAALESGEVVLKNETTGESILLDAHLTERNREILLAGGLLDYTRNA